MPEMLKERCLARIRLEQIAVNEPTGSDVDRIDAGLTVIGISVTAWWEEGSWKVSFTDANPNLSKFKAKRRVHLRHMGEDGEWQYDQYMPSTVLHRLVGGELILGGVQTKMPLNEFGRIDVFVDNTHYNNARERMWNEYLETKLGFAICFVNTVLLTSSVSCARGQQRTSAYSLILRPCKKL